MKIIHYSEVRRDECAHFWWHLYEHQPYVLRPDGYQNVNSPEHIDPDYFLRHLDAGLNKPSSRHWGGAVRDDSVLLAIDGEALVGMMFCSVDVEASRGGILSAYVHRDHRGRQTAALLVDEALRYFRHADLHAAVAGPDATKSMEVESPIHLALLDAGFRWTGDLTGWVTSDDEDAPYESPAYETYMGGSLAHFQVSPEIHQRIEALGRLGISIERYDSKDFDRLYSLTHDHFRGRRVHGESTFAALEQGRVVGLLGEVMTSTDWAECGTPRIQGGCVPHVVPEYRGKGIGKVLYHLGIEEVVRHGAECGSTQTGVSNHARSIYQSIGYEYWYLAFNRIEKNLTHNTQLS